MNTAILVGLLFGRLFLLVNQTSALCCPSDANGRCGDNTVGTPRCGVGRCNFFGCNCEGGCRDPPRCTCRGRRSAFRTSYSPSEIFQEVDINGDWQVDRDEFIMGASHLGASGIGAVASRAKRELGHNGDIRAYLVGEMAKMDKNGDGKISPEEFDVDLK